MKPLIPGFPLTHRKHSANVPARCREGNTVIATRPWRAPTASLLRSALMACGLLVNAARANALDAPEVVPRLVVYGPALGVSLNAPGGIAIDDKRGEIMVANTGARRIEVYSLNGRLRTHFTHRVRGRDGNSLPGQPAGLLIDPAGHTLVVDGLASYVDVLDFRGRALARLDLGRPGAGLPAANTVAGVAVAPNGELLVASGDDTARVYRFDARYRPLGCWEPRGNGSRVSGVRGIAVLPDGRCVLACAASKTVVKIFAAGGGFENAFGSHEVRPGNFSNPSGLAVTKDGRIWVSDEIRQSVQVFDADGTFLGAVSGAREFNYPSAIATDGASLLAVTERVGNRFQLLKIR